ncbi:MAG: 7-cyano-7-deazaguanine synthase [Acidobacteriota bacterium]|nr:7-cyano-7-deazaguanine synthase [Acidobacteriota bacterium]
MTAVSSRGRKHRRACVLISGGLDSCVLLAHLAEQGWELTPLYVRAGLVWERIELIWLRRFLARLNYSGIQPLRQLSLPVEDTYQSHWSTTGQAVPGAHSEDSAVYLPGRNLLLLSKAAVYCSLNRIGVIALGLLKGNPFPDATPAFLRGFERLASDALTHPLEILTPFRNLSKTEVVQLGTGLPLELTFSCIRPVGEKHCGGCNKCAERRRSFLEAGVQDRTDYHRLPGLEIRAGSVRGDQAD